MLVREASASYDGFTVTQDPANLKAAERAEQKLEELLAAGVEACRCPSCGGISREMQAKLDADRSQQVPNHLFLVVLGGGLGWVTWWLGRRVFANIELGEGWRAFRLALPALVAGGFSLLTGAAGLFGLISGYRDRFVSAIPEGEAPENEKTDRAVKLP